MEKYLVTLHVTSISLVVGALFLESLMVVMAMRLPNEQQQAGVSALLVRVHSFIYYPIFGVALLTGLWLANSTGAFGSGGWIHWKMVLVVFLAGLGLLVGREIRSGKVSKGPAMAVHVVIFLLSMIIIFLASTKPV